MRDKRVTYDNKIYRVIHDYGNGQLEIQEEHSSLVRTILLVKKEEVELESSSIEEFQCDEGVGKI